MERSVGFATVPGHCSLPGAARYGGFRQDLACAGDGTVVAGPTYSREEAGSDKTTPVEANGV